MILTLTSITPLAAQGTLGTEQPHLSCTFTDSEGRAVDGNALSAGDYTVSFTLSGMQSFAVMQYTMSYDAAVLTVNGHSDLLSDSLPDQLRGLGAAGVLVRMGPSTLALSPGWTRPPPPLPLMRRVNCF